MPTIQLLMVACLVHTTAFAGEADSIRFRLRGERDVLVPVTLDGQGPFHFLLDTGSSRSAITETLAEKLGLELTGRTRVATPSGIGLAPLARVHRLALGGIEVSDVSTMVLPDEDLRARGADGLLGRDILGGAAFTIDYRHRLFLWKDAAGATVPGIRLLLMSDAERLLVELPQGDGAAPLRLTPDSGAHSLVFFEHGEGSTPAMTPVDAGGLRTLSGIRVARRVLVDALDVGGIRLRNQMALVVRRSWPTGEDAGRLGDGLLPLHLFEEVTINVASGYLVVRGQRRQAQSASLR